MGSRRRKREGIFDFGGVFVLIVIGEGLVLLIWTAADVDVDSCFALVEVMGGKASSKRIP